MESNEDLTIELDSNDLKKVIELYGNSPNAEVINLIEEEENDDEVVIIEPSALGKRSLELFNLLKNKNFMRHISKKKETLTLCLDKEPNDISIHKKTKRRNSFKKCVYKIIPVKDISEENTTNTTKANYVHEFVSLGNHLHNLNLNSLSNISILSYNCLSQHCIKKDKASKRYLSLFHRMTKIVTQIHSLKPDVICLQEIDRNAYTILIKNLKDYEFIFNYDKAKNFTSLFFNMIGYVRVKFTSLCDNLKNNSINLDNFHVYGNREVLKALLRNKTTNEIICVYNIHLPWRALYLYQKCFILNTVVEDILKQKCRNLLLVGDFNCSPDAIPLKLLYDQRYLNNMIEAIDESIAERRCSYDKDKYSKWKNNQNSAFKDNDSYGNDSENEETKEEFNNDKTEYESMSGLFSNFTMLREEYGIKSAYDNYKILIKEKLNIGNFSSTHQDYTFYTANYRNTIDYIFFGKGLILTRILKMPDLKFLSMEGFLPNSLFPSDHLPLFAEFKIMKE